jgi:hypothetical protein
MPHPRRLAYAFGPRSLAALDTLRNQHRLPLGDPALPRPCATCRRLQLRPRQTALLEAMQQLTRCRRCGEFYTHHRAQHPHRLLAPDGEVQCDGWRDEETHHG